MNTRAKKASAGCAAIVVALTMFGFLSDTNWEQVLHRYPSGSPTVVSPPVNEDSKLAQTP